MLDLAEKYLSLRAASSREHRVAKQSRHLKALFDLLDCCALLATTTCMIGFAIAIHTTN
jgi:hypothetical protein